jgi:hypothetical protein
MLLTVAFNCKPLESFMAASFLCSAPCVHPGIWAHRRRRVIRFAT